MKLRRGQFWRFHNAALGTATEYELEHFEPDDVKGALAKLRNLETDGIAHITCKWLFEGTSRAPLSHWEAMD